MSQKIILGVLAVGILVFFLSRNSSDPLTPAQRSVATELGNYGFKDVDVTQLDPSALAEISVLLHSGKGTAHIKGNIGAILNKTSSN
ncbi:MAG: hypothetical protein AAGA12_04895 [Pseudomonadota bacterium]